MTRPLRYGIFGFGPMSYIYGLGILRGGNRIVAIGENPKFVPQSIPFDEGPSQSFTSTDWMCRLSKIAVLSILRLALPPSTLQFHTTLLEMITHADVDFVLLNDGKALELVNQSVELYRKHTQTIFCGNKRIILVLDCDCIDGSEIPELIRLHKHYERTSCDSQGQGGIGFCPAFYMRFDKSLQHLRNSSYLMGDRHSFSLCHMSSRAPSYSVPTNRMLPGAVDDSSPCQNINTKRNPRFSFLLSQIANELLFLFENDQVVEILPMAHDEDTATRDQHKRFVALRFRTRQRIFGTVHILMGQSMEYRKIVQCGDRGTSILKGIGCSADTSSVSVWTHDSPCMKRSASRTWRNKQKQAVSSNGTLGSILRFERRWKESIFAALEYMQQKYFASSSISRLSYENTLELLTTLHLANHMETGLSEDLMPISEYSTVWHEFKASCKID